ncbi:MAG: L-histidine N(alpha)-methyltransferase [Myxococcota bacterium]
MTKMLQIDVHVRPDEGSTLARDVREGLGTRPRSIPPKHFYDARGARLFDAICDTPEYYVTRTEQALLERVVDEVVAASEPTDLVELGSGAARKTRTLLEGMLRRGRPVRYVPLDVSEEMLRRSAEALLRDYPDLEVHGVVADYERHLDRLPDGGRRLVAFLGSTLGNFPDADAVDFLRRVAENLGEGDRLLLGLDLVKAPEVLDAAYNDAQGITEAFNKNVLAVINDQLDADFDLGAFEHDARFVPERSQVEIRLRSVEAQRVRIDRLEMTVDFEPGEAILTEISRKFTREGAEDTLARAGLGLDRWYASDDGYFALALARRK